MDWKELYREIRAAGFPDPGSDYRLNVLGRDLLPYFDGLTPDQIIAAVRNYGLVKQKPGSWWNSNPNILYWAKKHITNFLPENFRLEGYFNQENRGTDPETKRRRRLEAQVLGGDHETG
jgi:hypothetical protein